MSHTPEPWTIARKKHDGEFLQIEGNTGHIVCFFPWRIKEATPDARRIVACVNGCAGLNPAAYREVVEALREAIEWLEPREFSSIKQALAHAEQP